MALRFRQILMGLLLLASACNPKAFNTSSSKHDVTGRTTDCRTGLGVPHVRILVSPDADFRFETRQSYSLADGTFWFKQLHFSIGRQRAYYLGFQHPAFQPARVELLPGRSHIDVCLHPR